MIETRVRQHVLLFRPRFVNPILAGTKHQTIRAPRKRAIRPGDLLSLRRWTGTAYRSPQEEILSRNCYSVCPIYLWAATRDMVHIRVGGEFLNHDEVRTFAVADGFDSYEVMARYWLATHPGPFHGELIEWRET